MPIWEKIMNHKEQERLAARIESRKHLNGISAIGHALNSVYIFLFSILILTSIVGTIMSLPLLLFFTVDEVTQNWGFLAIAVVVSWLIKTRFIDKWIRRFPKIYATVNYLITSSLLVFLFYSHDETYINFNHVFNIVVFSAIAHFILYKLWWDYEVNVLGNDLG